MTPTKPNHLSQALYSFVDELDGRNTTIGAFTEQIGERGFGFILMILALPAALPIPAPGYATPFGLILGLLGLQLAKGRATPWLPRRLSNVQLRYSLISFSVKNASIPLRVAEWLVRPRLQALSKNTGIRLGVGLGIFILASMMCIPVPLTNTAPSFVIFILAAGLIEEDGWVLLAGLLLAPLAASLAGSAIYLSWAYGPEAAEEIIKPFLKGILGLS